jgi:hypothetical protein
MTIKEEIDSFIKQIKEKPPQTILQQTEELIQKLKPYCNNSEIGHNAYDHMLKELNGLKAIVKSYNDAASYYIQSYNRQKPLKILLGISILLCTVSGLGLSGLLAISSSITLPLLAIGTLGSIGGTFGMYKNNTEFKKYAQDVIIEYNKVNSKTIDLNAACLSLPDNDLILASHIITAPNASNPGGQDRVRTLGS